jgi:hypothetical protein
MTAIMAKRPNFIDRETFRLFLTRYDLDQLCSVDGVRASSWISRCERENRPLPFRSVQGPSRRGGDGCSKRWRPVDLWARAMADAVDFAQPVPTRLAIQIEDLRSELALLESKVAQSRHRLRVQDTSKALLGTHLLSEDEIVSSAAALPDSHCGVYFLIKDGRVVYVGQSVQILARVGTHLTCKDFDSFSWVRVPRHQLDLVETLYIQHLRPKYNGDAGPVSWVNICARVQASKPREISP